MERPNIEEYKKRLNGYYGMAFKHFMEHCKVQELLDYIEHLEKVNNGTDRK